MAKFICKIIREYYQHLFFYFVSFVYKYRALDCINLCKYFMNLVMFFWFVFCGGGGGGICSFCLMYIIGSYEFSILINTRVLHIFVYLGHSRYHHTQCSLNPWGLKTKQQHYLKIPVSMLFIK